MAEVWMEEEIGFPLDLETLPATVFFLNPPAGEREFPTFSPRENEEEKIK